MYGLLVPATPTALTTRAGIHSKDLQTWNSVLLALFGVGLLLSSPVAGYVADKCKSRRWPYLAALGGIAVGTALLCIGTHIGLWIAGKLLQGAASAVVWVVGNALVADTVGEEGIAESMGWTTMACSVGLLAGPLAGGVVYQYGGYYATFGIAFGLIAVDIALRLALIEKKYAMKWLNVEEATEAQSTQQDPEKNVVEDQLGSTASQDYTHYKPPRSPVIILLSSPRVLSAIWGNLIVSITMTSFDSVLPLFVHENFGWQQSGQGLVFLPLVVPHALSPLAGSLMDRFPKATRYIVGAAFLSSVPAMVLLRFVKENSVGHKVLLCVLLTVVGIFTSVALPAFFADVINVVKQKDLQSPDVFGQGGAGSWTGEYWIRDGEYCRAFLRGVYTAGCRVGHYGMGFGGVGWCDDSAYGLVDWRMDPLLEAKILDDFGWWIDARLTSRLPVPV